MLFKGIQGFQRAFLMLGNSDIKAGTLMLLFVMLPSKFALSTES